MAGVPARGAAGSAPVTGSVMSGHALSLWVDLLDCLGDLPLL